MEEIERQRIEAAWAVFSWRPESVPACNRVMLYGNEIEDYADRWPKFFSYQNFVGVIDKYDYVQWGGMGMNRECIGNEAFLSAIRTQTGY